MRFSLRKPHDVDQRHGSQQEIRGERSGGTCGLPIPTPHLRAKTALPFVISTEAQRGGEICGLPIPTPLLRATTALPFVISTEAQRGGEICGLLIPTPLLRATTALPFVISTEAQRSGEICGSTVPSWKCFGRKVPGNSHDNPLQTCIQSLANRLIFVPS
jgi:hypothetical protein